MEASQIGILLPVVEHDDFVGVEGVVKHGDADIALLHVQEVEAKELQSFRGLSAIHGWGEEVRALGYPEDSEEHGVVPTARLFSGTIQRFFTHSSLMGFQYRAGELSFGAPAGLSGGPIFTRNEEDRVVGVVVENRESTTYLRSVKELREENRIYSEKIHEMITYGIFVDLSPLEQWLKDNITQAAV